MELKTHFFALSKEGRATFAAACGTSVGHMRNVAYGYKQPAAELAVAIERESGKSVTRQGLYPETFAKIWPELATATTSTGTASV